MQNRRLVLTSPLLRWALRHTRRGEADSRVIVIIILAVVGGFMVLVCGVGALLLFPAIQASREAARRTQSRNNLHMIGIAMHNYHDVFNQFPPGGIYGEDGTEYISWQTSLLPYVDQAPLYNQIDVNVPWTDPAGRFTYSTVVDNYLHPSISDSPLNSQGMAVSHYAGNSQVFGPNSSTRISDFSDGTSNTILAGDVAAGFRAWADPGNLRDPAAGMSVGFNTFSGPPSQQGTQFVMGDGAVQFLGNDVSPDVLEALATPAGGETVPAF